MISIKALVPWARWILYSGNPAAKIMIPKNIAMVPIPKPQSHPLWICIHTMKVKLTAPPMQTASKRVLKKVDISLASLGTVTSNGSAPCVAGKLWFLHCQRPTSTGQWTAKLLDPSSVFHSEQLDQRHCNKVA